MPSQWQCRHLTTTHIHQLQVLTILQPTLRTMLRTIHCHPTTSRPCPRIQQCRRPQQAHTQLLIPTIVQPVHSPCIQCRPQRHHTHHITRSHLHLYQNGIQLKFL
uniref:Uncharacterized protein n=1 Tax=Cacopsylla melanoneura TaxID=428564 RepID=A0A8D8XH21_9HEMI